MLQVTQEKGPCHHDQPFLEGFPKERGPSAVAFAPCIDNHKTWSRTEVIDPLEKSKTSLLACLMGSIPSCKHLKTLMGKFSSSTFSISSLDLEKDVPGQLQAPLDFNH